MSKIAENLNKKFQDYRVIFWYDKEKKLYHEFSELSLGDVEKVEVDNNEFYLKHLIEREKPKDKFLLYFPYDKPEHHNNWLLDLELAYFVFHSDQEALYCQEVGLEFHFKELIGEHIEFFANKERRAKLKDLLGKNDEHKAIRYKMLAILFGVENIGLTSFIMAHATAFTNESKRYNKELERYNLKSFYWKEIERRFNYISDNPSIYDFLIEVFKNNFSLGERTGISNESKILLSVWKDSITYRESFKALSNKIADELNVEAKLNEATVDDVIEDDLFEIIDQKVISDLSYFIINEVYINGKVDQFIKKREYKYWYNEYQYFYACLKYGNDLIKLVKKHNQDQIESFQQGIKNYTDTYFEIDYDYRKFIHNYRLTKQNRALEELLDKVEKVYRNDWLFHFNNNWQKIIDNIDSWGDIHQISQNRFFTGHVKSFITKKQRVFVVVSDALRYECGWEYFRKIQNEKRFEGQMNYMVTSLPSYTQLGMANLLPHKHISIEPESDNVLVDGKSASGLQGRKNVLENYQEAKATAINAEDFMAMNASTDGRDFVKKHDLIYIFHNRIDKVGDDKTSEDKLTEAVEAEINYLLDVVKKISNMNGYNMLITADHGFLYQNHELDESDFSAGKVKGNIWKESRRYVIGQNLDGEKSTKHFTSEQLGLNGKGEVLIPKSINRIRVKGSGSRYVHGGATLQEIVVPLVKVTKVRKDTTKQVEIDVIKSSDKITTNLLAVSFLQTELVTEKTLPRTIRAALYADDGTILSDQFTYKFDKTEGLERTREVKHRFQLSANASGKYKNQRVKLILEEPVEGSNQWKHYKEYYYTLNISFTSDFDDI
ncbi:MAG: BREX-1 system phosphatase PglZ type A [Bacteroidales bacterium]|nr:BREX-1 system phosphatase PglZ type A [Bacteroidales bacterium]MCF8336416.1 BREX-1 system phosphatase PglZ type A [Bacteroidales bacterium]